MGSTNEQSIMNEQAIRHLYHVAEAATEDGKVTLFNCYVESMMMFARLGVLMNRRAALEV